MNINIKLIIISVVVCVAFFFVAYFYSWFNFIKLSNWVPGISRGVIKETEATTTSEFLIFKQQANDVRSLIENKKIIDAQVEIKKMSSEESLDKSNRQYLEYLSLLALQETNLNEEQKTELINQLVRISLDESYEDRTRAFCINDLLGMYFKDFDTQVFNKIFEGGYSKYLSKSSKSLSVRKLAESSYSLYPTAYALLAVNYFYNWEVLDNKNLDSKQKKEYIGILADNLKKIEKQFYFEFNVNQHNSSSYLNLVHRKAFVEGLIALKTDDAEMKATFSDKFIESYESVIGAYESKQSPRLVGTVPYSYFNYAAFLNENFGPKKKAKVDELLNKLRLVLVDKKEETMSFRSFIRQQLNKPASERDHNYYFLIDLMKINPDFSNFVKEVRAESK